jgi:colicin import membrane protein
MSNETNAGCALAEYSPTAAALADLRQRFSGVVWDLTTTKGGAEARAARLELVRLRTGLEAKRKELKAPALERSRLIDAEAARITGEIVALEKPIDEQIKADEQRREAEKEAKRLAEARRVQAIADRVNAIRALAVLPAGTKAADIAAGIAHAEGLELFDADFEEQLPAAERARGEVLGKLQALHVAAVEYEAEQARIAAERAELARLSAEQAEQARIAAEAARMEQARIAAEQQAERDRLAAERRQIEAAAQAERDRVAAMEAEQRLAHAAAEADQRRAAQALADERAAFERQQAASLAAEQQRANDAEDARRRALWLEEQAQVAPAPIPMQPVPAAADEPATLKLGDICARIAPLGISAAGLAELGIAHSATDKAAKLYRQSDIAAIRRALISHIEKALS